MKYLLGADKHKFLEEFLEGRHKANGPKPFLYCNNNFLEPVEWESAVLDKDGHSTKPAITVDQRVSAEYESKHLPIPERQELYWSARHKQYILAPEHCLTPKRTCAAGATDDRFSPSFIYICPRAFATMGKYVREKVLPSGGTVSGYWEALPSKTIDDFLHIEPGKPLNLYQPNSATLFHEVFIWFWEQKFRMTMAFVS